MLKRFAPFLLIWAILVTMNGCRHKVADQGNPPRTLNVFAAASLTESFRDIGKAFESRHPGVNVAFNFAGSQQLRQQLEQGAPADVFASANTKEMDSARAASLVAPDSMATFAQNRLIVIFPRANPAHITVLLDLARPGVRLDVADPAVPVGKYTMQMLNKVTLSSGVDFKRNVLANVVSREENVKSVVSKVRLGEVDAGMVYATDVTPETARDLSTLDIPDQFNPIADYPIAATVKAQQPELARQFIEFVLSPDGQKILHGYGFLPAEPTKKP